MADSSQNKRELRVLEADIMIMAAAGIWGASYSILKVGLEQMPMFFLLAWRFMIAAVMLAIIFNKKMRKVRWHEIKAGAFVGFLLFMGFATFSAGLRYTEAGRSSFICGLLVVIVPIINSILGKRMPQRNVIIGVSMATIGLAFMSLYDLHFKPGDLMILISAFFYAAHIVATGRYAQDIDGSVLVTIQLFLGGILFFILTFIFEPIPSHVSTMGIFAVIFLAVMASAVCLLLQTWAQKYSPPDHAAVLFTMEPVFGAIFAWVMLGEVMAVRALLGAGLILAGMLWVELGGRGYHKKKETVIAMPADDAALSEKEKAEVI